MATACFISAGRLHHLGQKHLALSEELSHLVHAGHERTFDDVHGMGILLQALP
jgi:hypothetical protein